MKKTTKMILVTALVASIPLGAFAFDGFKDRHDRDDKHGGFFEDCEDIYLLEKYKDANYEFEGKVQKRPVNSLNGTWTISGVEVIVNDNTYISHEKGNIQVGDEVEIIAKRANGKITALDFEQDD